MVQRGEQIGVVLIAFLAVTAIALGGALGAGATPGYEQTTTEDPDDSDDGDGDETDSGDGDESAGDEDADDGDEIDSGDGDDASADGGVFEIDDVETNAPIKAGEQLVTTVTVTNTGETDGETAVSFQLDQFVKDETTLAVEAGETETIELTYVSQRGDDGEWTHKTKTDDDSVYQTITIKEPDDGSDDSSSSSNGWSWSGGSSSSSSEAVFEITDVETNSPIEANETLNVTVSFENVGDADAEKRVWIEFANETVEHDTFALEPGESGTLNGSYQTSYDDHGVSTLIVGTPDDAVEESVNITEVVAELTVTDVNIPDEITAGDQVTITADIENTGERAISDNVSFVLENTTVDWTSIELDVNESRTVTFEYVSSSSAVGEWSATVVTSFDEATSVLSIVEPSSVEDADDNEQSDATDDDEEVESSALGSGFGAAVALAALLSASLLARRRG